MRMQKLLQRFVYPYLNRWVESIKDIGGYSILHSDGYILPYMDDIVASGVHALQAVDPTAGMDIYALQESYKGRLCLCGNMDNGLLVTADPENIYNAVCQLISACGPVGGYVFGCSNAVQTDVPAANYEAVVRAYQKEIKKRS